MDPGGGYFTINSYGGLRRKDFCYDPIPEILSDIDNQSHNICQILILNRRNNKKIRRQRDKGLRAGNEYFGSKSPLERGSDLRTFFNTKILEISSHETDHVLVEKFIQLYFHSTPITEYNSKQQSQKILSASIPQSQKFSSKRIHPNPRIFWPVTNQNWRTSPCYP